MEFSHTSVLLPECIEGLNINPVGIYIDGTAGGGGHSYEIASRLTTGTLLSLDRDPDAVRAASERLKNFKNAKVIHANFVSLKEALSDNGLLGADGILLDLGVSSHQLDTPGRGFSYRHDAPLDMRMSKAGKSAKDLVETLDEQELVRIFFRYGEEKFSRRIAAEIVKARREESIETTGQLADIIKRSVPARAKREKNPCKKVFQALRIAVNSELEALSEGLDNAFEALNPGGRLVVITFHSLEDRIVKQRFAEFSKGCTCPPDFPVCVCGKEPGARLVTRKPVLPDEHELKTNKRSQSAKLRILEKI